ncbi:MAG: site-specific DNA-methyltransferase [Phenylobacterium sp.]
MDHPKYQLINGNCLEVLKQLPDNSIHCVCTSPPYFLMRDYGLPKTTWEDGWVGCLGLEPSPEMYVSHMVEIFREIKRVLHKTGTCWLNLGDKYAGDTGGRGNYANVTDKQNSNLGSLSISKTVKWNHPTIKKKDAIGIPWMVAFALRTDGWYLRSDIIWLKPNCLPGSYTDRPVLAHEYIFLLSKSERYYYDHIAVQEPAAWDRWGKQTIKKGNQGTASWIEEKGKEELEEKTHKNKRTVWSIPTANFPEAHFAVMPNALVEPCVLAGTSAGGCCPECGNPLVRKVDKERVATRPGKNNKHDSTEMANRDPGRHITTYETKGWEKTCNHDFVEPVPCKVMDIFNGAATVGEVALSKDRDYIGIELNPEYIEISRRRLEKIDPIFIEESEIFKIGDINDTNKS